MNIDQLQAQLDADALLAAQALVAEQDAKNAYAAALASGNGVPQALAALNAATLAYMQALAVVVVDNAALLSAIGQLIAQQGPIGGKKRKA